MNRRKRSKSQFFFTLIMVLSVMVPAGLWASTTSKKITLAALGDCIVSRQFSCLDAPEFLSLVKLIRSADCAWANFEFPIGDEDRAYHQFREQDLPGICKAWTADELKWLGVDFVGFANNHTMDNGVAGLLASIKNLNRVGIGYAGAGINLEEAARPRYINSAGGRIGQVSCASTYHKGTPASPAHPYIKGRPGLNPLKVEWTFRLTKESYKALQVVHKEVDSYLKSQFGDYQNEGSSASKKNQAKVKKKGAKKKKEAGKKVKFLDYNFLPGEKSGLSGSLDGPDLRRIIDAVKIARRNSRIVIVSNHEHMGSKSQQAPAKILEDFARACIDAGADVVFNTGPHRIWGIEIYKGKPIFYSLGNFFFQITTEDYPAEVYETYKLDAHTLDGSLLSERVIAGYFNKTYYWQGFVPFITFDKENKLTDVKLYPIQLGLKEPLYQRGTPMRAAGKEARSIIEGLAKLSEVYKTKIDFLEEDNLGIIRLK